MYFCQCSIELWRKKRRTEPTKKTTRQTVEHNKIHQKTTEVSRFVTKGQTNVEG